MTVPQKTAALGATPWTTFLTITLPLIAPAVGSGWLLAFTLSLDDLILTQFVAGAQSQTLPMRVYSSVRLGVDPQINVLATIVIAIAASALLLWRFLRTGGLEMLRMMNASPDAHAHDGHSHHHHA